MKTSLQMKLLNKPPKTSKYITKREQRGVCLSFTQASGAQLKSCQEFAQMIFIRLFTKSQQSLYQ